MIKNNSPKGAPVFGNTKNNSPRMKYIGLLILPFLLIACPSPMENKPSPSVSVEPSPTSIPTKLGVLTILVKDGVNQQPVANAQVKVISGSGINKVQSTNNSGSTTFENLIEGLNYIIEVSSE